jgi:hypothetical protein
MGLFDTLFGKKTAAPVRGRQSRFSPPDWLVALMRVGDRAGFRWHTPDQIRAAAGRVTEFTKPAFMIVSEQTLTRSRALWDSMVPVADGPEFTARGGQVTRSRLFVNRDDPQGVLLALADDHPPTHWVPAGWTPEHLEMVVAAYFFDGIPPQPSLPFQGRLFLSTQSMLGGGFVDLERGVERSPFTDFLPWGNTHPTDPYPDAVTIGQIPIPELRRLMAQDRNELPRTSIRTRYSRAIIQLVDWRNGYFADLFFQPAPPGDWAEAHNVEFGTDFPPGTPVDVVGALSGLACIGPARIRQEAEESPDPNQRRGLMQIVGFLEEAHPAAGAHRR